VNEIVPLDQLATEIRYYSQQASWSIIEVGKRLIEAKKQVAHGEWADWLKNNVSFTQQTANKFMKCAERFSNYASIRNLNPTQMIALLALPETETETFIEQKKAEGNPVEDMTVKTLRDEIKKWKGKADQAEQENATLTEQYNAQAQELQDLKDNPTVVEVVPSDYNEIKTGYGNLQSKCKNLQSTNESYARENDNLRRKLAEKEAHESGMSLQEMAEENEAFSEYIKSKHEEAEDAKKFYEAIHNLSKLPNELPEIKELCRCYIAHEATEANRAFTMKSMAQEVRLNIRKLEAALEVFEQRTLGVVK
jgi:hypothetical protein